MKFIDLFAGLGGFHVALTNQGHKCVFACEKDETLRHLYVSNYGIECAGDIKKISTKQIPDHDILCAGFPCQPFSKAGRQVGLNDIDRGDLIFTILDILREKQPKYFILENVPNLKKHARQETWNFINSELKSLGYDVDEKILSPHEFGIPQIRKRIFIVGKLGVDSLSKFSFPIGNGESTDIRDILDNKPKEAKTLNEKQIECLNIWQKIIESIPTQDTLPGFPIWGMEFDASYPLYDKAPFKMRSDNLGKYRGMFGVSLKGMDKSTQLENLPRYATYDEDKFPEWKIQYIEKNRTFFKTYRSKIAKYLLQLRQFPHSWQKLEWNCGDSERNVFAHMIQFRASGIRIKKSNYSPALVLTSTQIPIIGWEKRYITLKEASRLQGLESIKLPESASDAYKALGNAVNVEIVGEVAKALLLFNVKKSPKGLVLAA